MPCSKSNTCWSHSNTPLPAAYGLLSTKASKNEVNRVDRLWKDDLTVPTKHWTLQHNQSGYLSLFILSLALPYWIRKEQKYRMSHESEKQHQTKQKFI